MKKSKEHPALMFQAIEDPDNQKTGFCVSNGNGFLKHYWTTFVKLRKGGWKVLDLLKVKAVQDYKKYCRV